ncbi:hypothetical protein N9V74_02195 [Alteromonas sp.]|nr:hypothetical protein [Alteromonas sp.]
MKRFHMFTACVCLFIVVACAEIPRVVINSADVKGTVIDSDTKVPIQGVKVTAVTSYGNASGARRRQQGIAYTDENGEFIIPENPTDISSYQTYIMSVPTLDLEKMGYCLKSVVGGTTSYQQGITIELSLPDGNCKVH